MAADLTHQAANSPHLLPMPDQVEANTARRTQAWLADAGYFDTEAIQALQACGVRAWIPPDKMRHRVRQRLELPPSPPLPDAPLREWMRYLLRLPQVLRRYRRRDQSVEAVFGQIQRGSGLASVPAEGAGQGSGALAAGLCSAQPVEALSGRSAVPKEPSGVRAGSTQGRGKAMGSRTSGATPPVAASCAPRATPHPRCQVFGRKPTQAASSVANTGPETLRAFYRRVKAKRGHQVAIVALAAKLVRIAWAVWRHASVYAGTRPALYAAKLRAPDRMGLSYPVDRILRALAKQPQRLVGRRTYPSPGPYASKTTAA